MKNKNLYLDIFRWMIIPAIFQVVYEVISIVTAFISAYYLGKTTDAALNGDYASFFYTGKILLLCLAGTVVLVPAMAVLMDFVWIKAGSVSDIEMCSQMSYWKYDKLKAYDEGEIEYKLSEELCEFRIRFATLLSTILVMPVFVVFFLYCIKYLGVVYTLAGIFCSAIVLIVPLIFRKRRMNSQRERWEYESIQNQIILQISEQAKTVKQMNLHGYFKERWHTKFSDFFSNSRKKANRVENFVGETNEFLKKISQLTILIIGCFFTQEKFITAGSIVMMIRFIDIFNIFTEKCLQFVMNISVIKEKAQRLHFLYEEKERYGGMNFEGSLEEIECRNLIYKYGEKEVIRQCSFSVSKGEKVQIIGDNGSGKTTLIRLLCGLEQDFEGDIFLNGISIKEIDLDAWRRRISIVFQNDYIIPATVLENVKIGNLNATASRIESVMQYVKIADMERSIEYGAKKLSGGEKKKIGIARAILKNSELVIFDEGDTHLDAETRKLLYKYINNSKQTIIYVSHNEVLRQLADKVVNL